MLERFTDWAQLGPMLFIQVHVFEDRVEIQTTASVWAEMTDLLDFDHWVQ